MFKDAKKITSIRNLTFILAAFYAILGAFMRYISGGTFIEIRTIGIGFFLLLVINQLLVLYEVYTFGKAHVSLLYNVPFILKGRQGKIITYVQLIVFIGMLIFLI
ncbi:hypothetical protein ACFLTH_04370 [Bacteroidota bacterium]